MIQIQLNNLKSLLDGELTHQTLMDYTGKVSYRYIITYEKKLIEEDNANNKGNS